MRLLHLTLTNPGKDDVRRLKMCLKLTKIIQSLVLRAPSWIHSTRKDVDIYACIRLGAQHSPGETVATKYMQTEMEVLHEDMG